MSTPALAPLGDFTAIPVATQIPQMIWAGVNGSSVLLANQDINNAVTIARRPSFAVGAGNTANVPALGSLTVDGSKSIWGLAPAGTANLLVLPGGSQWAPSPAQVAAQISALGLATFNEQVAQNTAIPTNISTTGTPLLNLSTAQSSGSNIGVSAGGSNSAGPFSLNQPGFELGITSGYAVANGATPYTFVVLKWTDPTSGLTIAKDTFVIWTAPFAANKAFPFIIRGPSKAGQVTLEVFNLDTVDNIQVTYTLLSDSRVIPAETIALGLDWKEDSANIQLFTNAATRVLPDSNVIGTFVNSSLAANGTDTWITPPATGLATLNFQETGVAGANMTVTVQPLPSTIYGGIFLVNDIMVTGNPNKLFYSNLILPNGPLQIQVHNGGTVAASYNGMLVAEMGT